MAEEDERDREREQLVEQEGEREARQRALEERLRSAQSGRPRWLRPLLIALIMTAGLSFVMRSETCGGLGGPAGPTIPYSELRQQVQEGNVEQVTLRGELVTGTLAEAAEIDSDGEGEVVSYTEFNAILPLTGDEGLLPLLEEHDVVIHTERAPGAGWMMGLATMLPFLLLLGLGWMFLSRMRAQGQQMMSIGQSRAKQFDKSDEDTVFDDVAGLDGAKGELREIIEFLKDPSRFRTLGGEPPKGVLLIGPPGTGKTLLARATAGEAGVPFFSITGSDFMEMFVGVGASRVRNLFAEAQKSAPAIIFIDELDSIGRRRGAGLGGGHDEREQTLNQLLSALDGFEPQQGVVVLGATNRPDILDPALQRPGRFDRHVVVDAPGVEARRQILRVHAREKPLGDDVDLDEIARGTPGFSGADLRNLLNEAALLGARKEKEVIEREDVEQARDKVMLGLEREGLVLTVEESEQSAVHEAGHAVVAAVRPLADPVRKVTIIPRARSLGVTETLPERDVYIISKDYALDRLAVMMGGRAAERVVLETSTSGAEQDLKEATKLARKMVLDWGMGEGLGPVAYGDGDEQVFLGQELGRSRSHSEATAREVDQAVRQLLEGAHEKALAVVEENRGWLDRVAAALVEKEELTGAEVLELAERTTGCADREQSEHSGEEDSADQRRVSE